MGKPRFEEMVRSMFVRSGENSNRIKPFDVWMSEAPRSPCEIRLYRLAQDEVERVRAEAARQETVH